MRKNAGYGVLAVKQVNNLINESRKIRHRIIFERIPSGQEFLMSLVDAMQSDSLVGVYYQTFQQSEVRQYRVEPYLLKIFRQRWYLIGKDCAEGRIKIFALDRVQEIVNTSEHFIFPQDFDGEDFFRHSYSVMIDLDVPVEWIKIRVEAALASYLRTLPLHHTQRENSRGKTHSEFAFHLRPTYDFCQELLSLGCRLEVLSPRWLREAFAGEVRRMKANYVHEKASSGGDSRYPFVMKNEV